MALIPSLKALTLELPPSCIAFCPSHPEFFVVGTYFLHPSNTSDAGVPDAGASIQQEEESDVQDGTSGDQQKRTGSLILFRLGEDDVMTHVVTLPTEYAILDIQWVPHAHAARLGNLLAVATSTGQLVFYRLDPRGEGNLVLSATKAVAEPPILVLALAWHPWRAHVIGFTLSDGSVCLCESTEGELWGQDAVLYQTTIQQHELEAWMLAFSGPGSTNVLSGGDDCMLQYSTINDQNERVIQWQDRKLHNAGVTAILPLTSELVITGSYDDHIRLIHFPQAGGRRKVLAEKNINGGVWRLKALSQPQLPCREGEQLEISSLVILASCMHAGARVVRLCKGENGNGGGDEEWSFEVLARFEEHESMNYGADVQPDRGLGGGAAAAGRRVVSISFYDKLMCLWRVPEEISRIEKQI